MALDYTGVDPQALLAEDPELDQLRSLYRQRMARMAGVEGQEKPNIGLSLLGGVMDAFAPYRQGMAQAASIASGKQVIAPGVPSATAAIEKGQAARRAAALQDVQMFKGLEDLAAKKRNEMLRFRANELDRAIKEEQYAAIMGDKESYRQAQDRRLMLQQQFQNEQNRLKAEEAMSMQEARLGGQKELEKQRAVSAQELEKLRASLRPAKVGGVGVGKPEKSPLEKLSGEQKMKVGMIGDSLRSLNQYETAFNQGARRSRITPETPIIGGLVSATPIDELTTKLSDDIGRLRSGGAINTDEEKRFQKMLPTAADNDATAMRKIENLRTEFRNKLSIFGIDEQMLGGAGFKIGTVAPKTKAAISIGTVKGGYRYKGGEPGNPKSWEKVK
jgi:hypothetical protein